MRAMVKTEIGKIVSAILWDTEAIRISSDNPFKLTSGNMSPIYIDCRVPISYPLARNIITTFAWYIYEELSIKADYVAGGETAGIPYAAWLANMINKPFVYIRQKPKGYGTGAWIEGTIKSGASVLLYEDLITDGKSKLNFIQGIRTAECYIENCLVICDRQQGGQEILEREGVKLHSMTNISEALEFGRINEYINREQSKSIQEYLVDPEKWHLVRGYEYKG
jgi:orotate phosphoribosyltransferase